MKYESLEEYNGLHKCCPKCGKKEYESTLVGYVFYKDEDYEDRNKIKCLCGWSGIKNDLIEGVKK